MHTINIRPRPPFDFTRTASFLRFTEAETVDKFADNKYHRLFHWGEALRLASVESQGTPSRPSLIVSLEQEKEEATPQDLQQTARLIERVFSTGHDLKKFRAAVASDSLMGEIEAAHRGQHLARWPTLFEALSTSVLLQQISTAVAVILKRRLVEAYGARLTIDSETFFAFPRAEVLAEASVEALRAFGISSAKAASIIAVARETTSGALDESELETMDNETIIERLTRLRGIGRWTAEWVLMLYFGRADVFPAGDLALRNFVYKYYNDSAKMSEREMREFAAARWGEWSSYVAIYVLAALRTGVINLRPDDVLLSTKARRGNRKSSARAK